MKTKHLNKKLSFSKQTIADLNRGEMKIAKGGSVTGLTVCVTCLITVCIDVTCNCTNGDICRTVKNSCFGELCPGPIPVIDKDIPMEM